MRLNTAILRMDCWSTVYKSIQIILVNWKIKHIQNDIIKTIFESDDNFNTSLFP